MGRIRKAALGIIHVAVGLGVAALLPDQAWAQTPDASQASSVTATPGTGGTEEIVVTATRKQERLQSVPISITVFNDQQLSNHNIVNAQDLAEYTPSLSVHNVFGSENTSFAIRGFVQDSGTDPS